MGSFSVSAYMLPQETMAGCSYFDHICIAYLMSSFVAGLVQLCMYHARGHEDSAKMAGVFTLLAVVTAALSLFSGFTITILEACRKCEFKEVSVHDLRQSLSMIIYF